MEHQEQTPLLHPAGAANSTRTFGSFGWALGGSVLSGVAAILSSISLVSQDWVLKPDYSRASLVTDGQFGLWQVCGTLRTSSEIICKSYSAADDLLLFFFLNLDSHARGLLEASCAFCVAGFAVCAAAHVCIVLGYLRKHLRSKKIALFCACTSALCFLLCMSTIAAFANMNSIVGLEDSSNGHVSWTFGINVISMVMLIALSGIVFMDLRQNSESYSNIPCEPWGPILTKFPLVAHLVIAMATDMDSTHQYSYNVFVFCACLSVRLLNEGFVLRLTTIILLGGSIVLDTITLGIFGGEVLQSGTYMERFSLSGTILSLVFKPLTLFFLSRELRLLKLGPALPSTSAAAVLALPAVPSTHNLTGHVTANVSNLVTGPTLRIQTVTPAFNPLPLAANVEPSGGVGTGASIAAARSDNGVAKLPTVLADVNPSIPHSLSDSEPRLRSASTVSARLRAGSTISTASGRGQDLLPRPAETRDNKPFVANSSLPLATSMSRPIVPATTLVSLDAVSSETTTAVVPAGRAAPAPSERLSADGSAVSTAVDANVSSPIVVPIVPGSVAARISMLSSAVLAPEVLLPSQSTIATAPIPTSTISLPVASSHISLPDPVITPPATAPSAVASPVDNPAPAPPPELAVADGDLFTSADAIDLDTVVSVPGGKSRRQAQKAARLATKAAEEQDAARQADEEKKELQLLRVEAQQRSAVLAAAALEAQRAEEEVLRRSLAEQASATEAILSPVNLTDTASCSSRDAAIVGSELDKSNSDVKFDKPKSMNAAKIVARDLRHTSVIPGSSEDGYTCRDCGQIFADMIIAELHRVAHHTAPPAI